MRGAGAESRGPRAGGLSLALGGGGGDTGLLLRGGGGAALTGGDCIGLGAGAGAGGWGAWFIWLLTSRLEGGGAGTGGDWGLLITLTWFAMLGCGEALRGGPGPPPAMAPLGLGGPGPALPVPGSSSLRAGGGPGAEVRAPGPIPAPDSDTPKAPENREALYQVCMGEPVKWANCQVLYGFKSKPLSFNTDFV